LVHLSKSQQHQQQTDRQNLLSVVFISISRHGEFLPSQQRGAEQGTISQVAQQGQQSSVEDMMREMLQLMKDIKESNQRREERSQKREEREQRIQVNARKSAGDCFVPSGALWGKAHIKNVKADQSCEAVVPLIAEKLEELFLCWSAACPKMMMAHWCPSQIPNGVWK